MKRALTVLAAMTIALGVGTAPAQADSFSNSHSGSCSGTANPWGDFYAYTYQYVYIYDNQIESESHSFSFSGFLDGAEEAVLIGGRDNQWTIYRAGDYDLAVPYIAGAGLFVQDNRHAGNEWVKLCSY
ncbi:hypothetical protein ACFVVM_15250 [Nocardia sp. NPDC058176]|uniref:hypothetical protein n=1 Tax=Nocardia sp. NPDC058176 TaxID=3346368 RepID=UPI0036D7E0B5